jgi:hypothetical protein
MPIEHFGGVESLEKTQRYDNMKKRKCNEQGIKLIYYLDKKFNKYMDEGDIYFNDVNTLIDYIKT